MTATRLCRSPARIGQRPHLALKSCTACYSLCMLPNSITKRLCAHDLALSLVPVTKRAMGESITTITNTAA